MEYSPTCDKLKDMIQDGWRLLDVRTAHEFHHGHLMGALHVPLQEIGSVDPDGKYLVYCRTGARSHTGALYLMMQDTDAINIGGFEQLRECFGVE